MRQRHDSLALLAMCVLVFGPGIAGCGFGSGGESAEMAAPCTVRHRVTNQWPGGFQVNVSFTWTGGDLHGWVMQIEYAASDFQVTGWSARWSQTGPTVTAVSEDWNGTVYHGATLDGLGYNATGGTAPHVRSITVNGARCTPR